MVGMTKNGLLAAALILWLLVPSALAAPAEGTETPEGMETVEISAGTGAEVSEAAQTDPDYSGPLDPMTGLPSSAGGGSDTFYWLREGEYGYDREERAFSNVLGSGAFSSNIPNGAVVSEGQTVSFTLPSGMTATLFREGDPVENSDLTAITEPGGYLLEVRSGGAGSVSFSFRILGETTNALNELTLPAGFSFDYVNLNGEGLTLEYSNYLELLEDGAYELRWSCPDIAQSYTLSFTLDRAAPTLALPEVTGGEAHSEVTLADLEAGAYIVLERDGESSTITSPDTVIRDAGDYRLTVCDQAGNSTVYEFTIHMYLNLSAVAAIGLALAGLAALWGYSRYIRKHPRVG